MRLTDDQEELLERLRDLYGLEGDPCDLERMDVPEKFSIGLTAGDQRYFLKWCGDGARGLTAHERFQIDVQTYLHRRGFLIPRIVPTVDGESVLAWRGGKYMMFDFIGEGYDPAQKTEQLEAVATALGELHSQTAESGITGYYWDYDPKLRFPVEFLAYRRRALASSDLSNEQSDKVARCLDEMDAILTDSIRQLTDEDWFSLPHIPIHGDFGPHNCRFSGSRLAAVIDWGMARMAPRIMDVATGMNTALGPGADDHFPGWENVELVVPGVGEVRAWVSAYQKNAPAFSEKEARLFPLVCAALWAIWGHPPMDDARIDNGSLVVDYMRCLLEDVWELAAKLRR